MAVKDGAVVHYGHIYPVALERRQAWHDIEKLRGDIANGKSFASNDVIITSISRLP